MHVKQLIHFYAAIAKLTINSVDCWLIYLYCFDSYKVTSLIQYVKLQLNGKYCVSFAYYLQIIMHDKSLDRAYQYWVTPLIDLTSFV